MAEKRQAHPNPDWLQPLWKQKRQETTKRVAAAVRHLVAHRESVTLESIRATVKALSGISISTNTIQRNEDAYEIYRKHRAETRRTPAKDVSLSRLLRNTVMEQRGALRAKINRLRRKSKEDLIFKLLQLEKTVQDQAERENTLREEVLRLSLERENRRSK